MSVPKIGIVIGSTREGRFADKPAQWFYELAQARQDLSFELIDLRDYPMPFFEDPTSPARTPPRNPEAVRWGAKIAEMDGLILVTAEYNHGPTAVLKNALDYAYNEFVRKPVSFIGYGGVGAARAVQQLRQITVELQMAPLRFAVHIGMLEGMGIRQGKSFDDFPHLKTAADNMLNDMAWWASVLKAGREAS